MIPPMNRWGLIYKGGLPWVTATVKFKRAAEGGRYQLVRQGGDVVPGTFELIDFGKGFRIRTKKGGESAECRWVPRGRAA